MAASPERAPRRRYVALPEASAAHLTPKRLAALQWVAECGLLTTPQVARLLGVRDQAARRLVRPLFDAGLLQIIAVPRAALAGPEAANDPALLYGSAPSIWSVSRSGAEALGRVDLLPEGFRLRERYGPKNMLFLRHELGVRDARVFFTLCGRGQPEQGLERWRDGPAAEVELGRSSPPRVLRPDAILAYRLGERRLAAFLEWDEGTERGRGRWGEKLDAYAALFANPHLVRAITGYGRARVLVVAPSARRRDALAELIARHVPAALAERFWLAERGALQTARLDAPAWRTPAVSALQPLVSPELIAPAANRTSAPFPEAPELRVPPGGVSRNPLIMPDEEISRRRR